MAERGAQIQSHTNELVVLIEAIREKRQAVVEAMLADEREYDEVTSDIGVLQDRLSAIERRMNARAESVKDFDATLAECEAAFERLEEGSRHLLLSLKREMGGEASPMFGS